MRRIASLIVATLAATLVALPAAAQPASNDNWHVHDGGQSASELKTFGEAFFPALFAAEGLAYDPVNDPVVCPDATDKAGLLPGHGNATNRPANSGVCMTEAVVIHLRSAAGGSGRMPAGWSAISFGPAQSVFYYKVTTKG